MSKIISIDAKELNGVDGWFSQLFTPNADERDKYIEELNNVHQPMLDALKSEYEGKSRQLVAQANTDKANFDREKASLEAQITQKRKEKADREAAAKAIADTKASGDANALALANANALALAQAGAKSKEVNTGGTEVKKDNTMLIVACVGGALTLTAIVVGVVMMNKKKPAKPVNGTPRKRK